MSSVPSGRQRGLGRGRGRWVVALGALLLTWAAYGQAPPALEPAGGDHLTATLQVGAQPQGLLLLQRAVDPSGKPMGCGVVISRKEVSLVEVAGGVTTTLMTALKPKGMPKAKKTIQVSAWRVGDAWAVDVSAGEAAVVSLRGASGRCGVGDVGASLVSARDLSLTEQRAQPLCAPDPLPARAARRFVTVDDKRWERLPSTLRAQFTPLGSDRPNTLTLRGDAFGVAALRCAGVTPLDEVSIAATKHLDAAYWEAAARGPQPPPYEDSAPLPNLTDHYLSPEQVNDALIALHHQRPDLTRLIELGRTHQGRPILALAVGDQARADNPTAATALFNGAHHGDEALSTLLVLDIAQRLLDDPEDPDARRWLSTFVIWLVPVVNPDGVYANHAHNARAGRKNAYGYADPTASLEPHDGVDLNRNYPWRWRALGERGSRSEPTHSRFRGPTPASEPETRAMMALADAERFVLSVSFHTGTIAILTPYTIEGALNPKPDEAAAVAQALADLLAPIETGRRFEAKPGLYPVDGTDQDWHRFTHGTLALLIEAYPYSPQDPPTRAAAIARLRPAWQHLLDRYALGPSLQGTVTDPDGHPVSAQIVIDPIQTFNGESWTSRPRDGHFARVLTSPGRYTARALLHGKTIASQSVQVSHGLSRVHLTVPASADASADAPAVASTHTTTTPPAPLAISPKTLYATLPRRLNQAAYAGITAGSSARTPPPRPIAVSKPASPPPPPAPAAAPAPPTQQPSIQSGESCRVLTTRRSHHAPWMMWLVAWRALRRGAQEARSLLHRSLRAVG
jgi:hypothetical protein